ncbi:hypothetical protein SALWKB12_2092 [Snodgrassella communis]|uniref:hypothetical protein n=1 Tax=Snodgrassella communis TaxID=2946699 RepID=UPI000461871D|nr:hypothetical protein [Snodgrassella communis]KDN11596.1 hypothetical protein SALWKB12_2092 [Snodgrassella communis]
MRAGIAGIRFCALNPTCNKLATEAIKLGIIGWLTTLPTVPTLSENKIPDGGKCKTKDVEISDANIGGAPNPPDPDDDDLKDEQEQRIEEILKGSNRLGKKGSTKLYERIDSGKNSWEKAQKDFKSLKLRNTQSLPTKYGTGQRGNLADGRTVVARPGSSNGKVTLEIRASKNNVTKIRYPN